MAKRRSDIKPSVELPDLNSQPKYHGQDLHDLLGDARSKVDMNWLEALGGGKPGSTTGFNGGTTTPNNPNPANPSTLNFDSDWKDILNQLGYGDQFTQFLSQLGIGGKDPYDQSMHDLNQSIYQAILQHYVNEEQRSYDRALQKDQRLYDSPLNQLARLMGAGISRDAAIQMMSGSGSGSGAAVPYGSQGSQILGESASQAYANQMAGATSIANTVFNGISAISGLVGLGFSLPQAYMQSKMLANQKYMSDQQRIAFDAASNAYGIITNAGVKNAADVFGSIQSTADTITTLAKNGDIAAQAFLNSGGIQNLLKTAPISSPLLAELHRNERSAGDYSSLTDSAIKQARLNQCYTQAMTDKIGSEMSLMGTQEDLVNQQIIESAKRVASLDADIKVKNAEGRFISLQSDNYYRLVDSQIKKNWAEAELAQNQADIDAQQFELNDAGFPMLKEARILELQDELSKWQTITREDVRNARIQQWVQNEKNARACAYLESIRLNAVGDFASTHPGIFNLAASYYYVGASQLVKATGGAVMGSAGALRAL